MILSSSIFKTENKEISKPLWLLLFFLFAGIIVGENACEAILITHFGYHILPKIYIANSLLLFFVTPFVFSFIDRIERDKLLSVFIKYAVYIIIAFRIILFFTSGFVVSFPKAYSLSIITIYMFSYVFKIILFSIFWTLANDITNTRQSKSLFPIIASGGIIGGMLAAGIAKLIIGYVDVYNLFFLWALLLLMCLPIITHIRKKFFVELHRSEFEEKLNKNPFSILKTKKNTTSGNLIKIMSVLYFLIFIIIFNFDFQFSKALNIKYSSPADFAGFKYKFYFFHSFVTILFQWLIAGVLIKRFSIVTIMAALPIYFGIVSIFSWISFKTTGKNVGFSVLIFFQFFRYVFFESIFSPSYQVFFNMLHKELRGRSKLILEGAVKPISIFISGLLIYLAFNLNIILYSGLIIASLALGVILWLLKKQYPKNLLEEIMNDGIKKEFVKKIDSTDKSILPLLNKCIKSNDPDLKRVAISGLGWLGTPEAYSVFNSLLEQESDVVIQEFMVKSMARFSMEENKYKLLHFCDNKNSRIVANALYSLRHSTFKANPEAVNKAKLLANHNDIRIAIEATLLLWQLKDLNIWTDIEVKIQKWMNSKSLNTRVAAIYLIGELGDSTWLPIIWEGIISDTPAVWKKSIDVLANFHIPEAWEILSNFLSKAPREKEKRIVRALGKLPISAWSDIQAKFLNTNNSRTIFALTEIMRRIAINSNLKVINIREPVKEKLNKIILKELETIYTEIFCLYKLKEKYKNSNMDLLDVAISEKRNRVITFLLDMLSLLDKTGQLLKSKLKFHNSDRKTHDKFIEILELSNIKDLSSLLTPLIESTSLKKLADFGNKRWNFNKILENKYEEYILNTNNSWIKAVAIFTFYTVDKNKKDIDKLNSIIKESSNNNSPIVASCITEFKEYATS